MRGHRIVHTVRAENSIARRTQTGRAPSWPDRETSRLLNAVESIHAQDDLSTFHVCLFQAISGLVEDVVLTMDSTRLMDGKAESRNTKEGIISKQMQSLLLLLLPENPAAPALRTGARGLLRVTDFVTQRDFERTALYNEIMRPNDVRYQLLIGQILNSKTRTVEKHTQHIFTKLGVETRTAAALVALERTALRR
jgi:hypothetical protein